MSSNRATRRYNARHGVKTATVVPTQPSRSLFTKLRGYSTSAVFLMFALAACYCIAFPAKDANQFQQTASVASRDGVNPLMGLARLNHRLPASQSTTAASLIGMEGYSTSNTNLMLAGFGGGGQQGQQSTTVDCIYDGQNMVRTLKDGGPGATYLTGPTGPVYRRNDATGQVRWYLPDGVGNILGEVDPQGNVTSSRKFDVFGNVRGGNNPGGTSKHKFQGMWGHLSEDETGLTYMRARYFDPVIGRFISQDPAYRGFNWFHYASSNPVNRVDFNGRDDMAEEMEAGEISQELQGANGTADFGAAKWYDSRGLLKAIMKQMNCSKDVAGDIIHAAKEFGLGPADNIGLDSAGGLWSKSVEFLGFIDMML